MKPIPILIAAAVVFLTGGAATAPGPMITIRIKPGEMNEAVGKGWMDVTIRVPAGAQAGAPTLNRFAGRLDSERQALDSQFSVQDALGSVPRAAHQDNVSNWTPARAVKGDLTIRYRVHVENLPTNGGIPPLGPRIDGRAFSASGQTFLALPESTAPCRIGIKWDLKSMGPGAAGVSSFGDGDVVVPAGPLARLDRALFMAGQLKREPLKVRETGFSAAWSGDPGFDLHPVMQWTHVLHDWMSTFFRDEEKPPYRVLLRFNPSNAGGGVASIHSFMATYGDGITAESLKRTFGHEMTHTWTAHGIGLWYDEGNAVYYQVQLPWRAGLLMTDDYLDDINKTASRYYTNAEINAPEAILQPNFWKNAWLNTLGYDRGALYFAILNGKIKRASGGKRSVDDLILTMASRARAGQTASEGVWLDLLGHEIGEDGLAVHRSMMAGGVLVPESTDYGPCFRRVTKKIRRFELGFTNSGRPGGGAVVQDLVAGSEASKAGLRNGDIVTYRAITTEGIRRDPDATVTMHVTREGQRFDVTYLPRGLAMDVFQWERVPGVPESACKP
jgi:predicted metalloprotease with PDZ domain